MSALSQLQEILNRLLADQDTPSDCETLKSQLLQGKVLFSESDRNIAVGGNASGVFVSGNGNTVMVQLDEASHQVVRTKLFSSADGIPPPPPSLLFLGRADDLSAIKGLLRGQDGGSRVAVVDGWPGVGKTSIAGVLGLDRELQNSYPDGTLWTALGPSPNLFTALAAWGRALGADDLLRVASMGELTARLNRLLSNRRMLLIVDDIWDVGHATPFLSARTNDCGLLFTTRQPSVAEGFTNHNVQRHRLPVLGEEDALKLLWSLSADTVDQHEQACRSLVRDLEFLPLSIHVAGRLLRSEQKLGWGVLELLKEIRTGATIIRERAPEDRAEEGIRPTVQALLQKSTDFLDSRTRDYFAYLGVFAPKPATFDIEAMKAVWQEDDPKPFVRKLVGHGLLEATGAGRFQMHALLVAHAKSFLEDD